MTIISRKMGINAVLFLALIILAGTSILAYNQIQRLIDANKWVVHTHKVIENADKAIVTFTELESKISLFLLTKDKSNIQDLPDFFSKINQLTSTIKILTKDNPYQQKNLEKLDALIQDKINVISQILKENPITPGSVITLSDSNKKRLELKKQISDLISIITNQEISLLEERNVVSLYNAKKINLILIVTGAVSEIIFLLWVIILNYQLIQKDKIELKQLKTEQELSRKNKKLTKMQKRYDLAVKGSNTGLWDWKVGSEKVYYSESFKNLLGYTGSEFSDLYVTFVDSLHPDDLILFNKIIKRHLEVNRPFKIEYRLRNKNGEYRWYQAEGESIKDNKGNPKRMSGTIIDITARKKTEQMKNEFIAVISHELRTPLTAIDGAINFLENIELNLTDKSKKLLSIAKNNSERLIRLINNMLDIEKIESGNIESDFTQFELAAVLKEAVFLNEEYANRLTVKMEITKELPQVMVKADRDKLIQVFTNLISNAIKFSPPHETVTLDITITNQNTVRCSISDKGEGVPELFKTQIFKKFSQADSSISRKHEGTGLGLYVSKSIIEKLGGKLGFINNEQRGTTFYFEIPICESILQSISN